MLEGKPLALLGIFSTLHHHTPVLLTAQCDTYLRLSRLKDLPTCIQELNRHDDRQVTASTDLTEA